MNKLFTRQDQCVTGQDQCILGLGRPAATPEPMSKPGKKYILAEVVKDLDARDKLGQKKYKTSLQTFNGRNALNDAYQECLDMAMYLKQTLMEQEDGTETKRQDEEPMNEHDFHWYQSEIGIPDIDACYTNKYLILGFQAEVGELIGKVAKRLRGDNIHNVDILLEIGDVAWMIATRASLHKKNLKQIYYIHTTKDSIEDDLDKLLGSAKNINFNYLFGFLRYICEETFNLDFREALAMNIRKQTRREKNDTIHGNGDHR